ncbi:MAG: radical SAM protein [Candidatus Woesearchaeota archaeon]
MKKIFFVSTENGCNNNCIGCADNNIDKLKNGRDINDIFDDLEKGFKLGYKNLHITGGEFTIQDNIFLILRKAVSLYDEVYITSNGRRFSYLPFAKKMVDIGITQFNITLCGDKKNHDYWTQVPGSFDETISGINNLISLNANVCVNYLLWKGAFNDIQKVLGLIHDLGVKNLDIFNLVPLGNAKSIYSDILVPISSLNVLEKYLKNLSFNNIEIEDFPLCIFSKEFSKLNNVHIFDTSGQIFYDPNGDVINYSVFAAREFGLCLNSNLTVKEGINKVKDKFHNYRIKVDACNGCLMYDKCAGVFTDYVKLNDVNNELISLRKSQGY